MSWGCQAQLCQCTFPQYCERHKQAEVTPANIQVHPHHVKEGCAMQLNSSCTCFFPPFSRSYHPVLYIQMSHPENQKGNRGTARTKTGRQEIRQHIRDGAASE